MRFIRYIVGGIFLVLTAMAWHKWHTNPIVIESMGFRLETSVFNAIIALVAATFVLLFLYQGTIGIIKWPVTLWRTFVGKRPGDCISQIEDLLVEISKHNYDNAQIILDKLDHHKLPPRLKLILANSVATLSNELEVIKQSFVDLAGCPETRDAGLEGLITVCMQELDWEAAHQCCLQLWKSAPSEWLAATHIFILIHAGSWAELSKLLENDRFKTFYRPEAVCQLSLVALYYEAIAGCEEGKDSEVKLAVEAGIKEYGYTFMPINILLAELYLKDKNVEKLEELLTNAWEIQPHDALADLAMELAGHYSKPRFFTKVMKMVKPLDKEYESLLLVARAALSCDLYEEGYAALSSAIKQQEGVRACLMMAEYHQSTGAKLSKTMEWLNRATKASNDRLVVCYYWDTALQQLTNEHTCTSLLIACVTNER